MAVPVISSRVLQGLPAFIRGEIGERALQRANRAAGFDAELVENRSCYISQRSVLDFLEVVTRSAGEPDLGLLIAPAMDVAEYGTFGRYVFAADTLGQAIRRGIAALRYHSTGDRLSITATGDRVRFGYAFALARTRGYGPAAATAAGELLSVFRAYLPDNWRPLRVELDIPRPRNAARFEDVFQCPVLFDAPDVAVVAGRHVMAAASRRLSRSIVTIEDVARDRVDGAPRQLTGVAAEQIRIQLLAGEVSLEQAARSMDTSVRTLQRELNRAGTDFRTLTGIVRIERATELLRHPGVSITAISEDLGYSSLAGFSRAFRNATGASPSAFRTRESGRHGVK